MSADSIVPQGAPDRGEELIEAAEKLKADLWAQASGQGRVWKPVEAVKVVEALIRRCAEREAERAEPSEWNSLIEENARLTAELSQERADNKALRESHLKLGDYGQEFLERAEAAEARVAELQQAADDWFERRVEIRARAEELAHFSPGDAYAQRVGRDLLDALDGPGLEPGGWQPIETKPQDGALVVGYLRRMECYEFVRWSESSALWMQDEVSGWRDDQLAAWAPLPLPPPPAGEEETGHPLHESALTAPTDANSCDVSEAPAGEWETECSPELATELDATSADMAAGEYVGLEDLDNGEAPAGAESGEGES